MLSGRTHFKGLHSSLTSALSWGRGPAPASSADGEQEDEGRTVTPPGREQGLRHDRYAADVRADEMSSNSWWNPS